MSWPFGNGTKKAKQDQGEKRDVLPEYEKSYDPYAASSSEDPFRAGQDFGSFSDNQLASGEVTEDTTSIAFDADNEQDSLGDSRSLEPPRPRRQTLSPSSSSSSSPPPPALLPDTVCYNAALSALARAGRWQEALSLLVEMRIQFERYGPGTYFSSNENAAHGRPTGLPASSSAASMRFDSCYDVQTFNTVREAIQECQFMPEVPGSCINVSSFLARR